MSVEKGSSEGHRGERARRAQSTQRHFDGILHGRKPSRSIEGRLHMGLSQILALNGMLTMGREMPLRKSWSEPMILTAIAEKLKRQSKDNFNGRHFEA
ncbi:hypothetical protein GGE56_007645 [Rhizobium leguminosarum]|nr:hypothetical protein [Rhizobium leguminosarum]MBB6299286.1 hypothetical protein [Rhizobium leguminosarum]